MGIFDTFSEALRDYLTSQHQAWGGMNGVLCDASHASFTDGVWSKTHASNYSEVCVFNLWRASLLNWGVRIRDNELFLFVALSMFANEIDAHNEVVSCRSHQVMCSKCSSRTPFQQSRTGGSW